MELFISLAGSLLLTLTLELSFALIWRVEHSDLPAVVLANVLTNPIVVLCFHIVAWYAPSLRLAVTVTLELGAAAVEGLIYSRRSQIAHPVVFSLCANAFSFLTGLLL